MKIQSFPFRPGARRGFTLIELLVVISIIAVLASLAFPVTQSVLQRARKTKVQAMVKDIQVAINNYLTEYNRLPTRNSSGADEEIQTDESNDLIAVLLAEEETLNPRGITFINIKPAKNNIGGLIDNGGSSLSLVDDWGMPYWVIMDTDNDNKITPNPDQQNDDQNIQQNAPPDLRTRVAVFSVGPDKERGTKDDIVSWR